MKKTEEEEIMIIDDEKECVNDDHEDKDVDGPNEAQVSLLLNHISVVYIAKYTLFHICRKCDFNSDFFSPIAPACASATVLP
jgi:hypothetical protein